MSTTFRHAWRSVASAPLASVGIVLSVAIGVGPATTVFTWIEHLIRRPLPTVRSMDQLVTVVAREEQRDERLSYLEYLDCRDAMSELSGLAAFGLRQFAVRTAGEPAERTRATWGVIVSDNYFDVLGVRLAAGVFGGGEWASGGTPEAVISRRLALERFGGETAALGRGLRINDVPFTIAAVAPEAFTGTIAGLAFDVWVPLMLHPRMTGDADVLQRRDARWLQAFGRLREGSTPLAAGAEAQAIGIHLAETSPDASRRELLVRPLDTGVAARLNALFGVLLGIAGLVTLVVCTNVANLLMLRGAMRRHDIGIRLALGAGRGRIVTQLLIEAAVLALAGAVAGLLLARWAQTLLPALMPPSPLPFALEARGGGRALAFALALSGAMVMAFAVAPAIQTMRSAVLPHLTVGRGGPGRGAARLRAALVAAQLALSLAALACTGLFLRAGAALSSVDRGFSRPEEVLVVSTELDQGGYRTSGARIQAAERLLAAARAVPGVRGAALATFVPLGFVGYSSLPARIPGYAPREGEDMTVLTNRVSADYFRTLGVAIREGRAIDGRDTDRSARVVVVNQAFASRFLPGRTVLGSRIDLGGEAFTIVGVAADGKYRFDALDEPAPPFVYLAFLQQDRNSVTLHVRADGSLEPFMTALREAFAGVNPALPMNGPASLDEYTSLPLFPVRLATTVLSSLGALALLLASTGLYAVVAYRLTQRRRELAVRMALGASASRIVRLIAGEGLRQIGVGLAFGTLLGLVAMRIVVARLPRAGAADPSVLVAAAGMLVAVSLVAAVLPAARALRMDPVRALRTE